jgi:hypothetical protein
VNHERQWRVPKDVVFQTLGPEMVLLNLHTGVYWSLNESGARIWKEISSHGNEQKTLDALGSHYSASRSELRAAVQQLVEDLVREGLLERCIP